MRHYDGSYRSTREAFANERFAAIEIYRPSFMARWYPRIARAIAVVAIFGALGALLGWGGKVFP